MIVDGRVWCYRFKQVARARMLAIHWHTRFVFIGDMHKREKLGRRIHLQNTCIQLSNCLGSLFRLARREGCPKTNHNLRRKSA